MTNQVDRLFEPRPEWHAQALCRGMLQAFTESEHEDQVAVCNGTISPWAQPCPVRGECLKWFVERTVNVDGMQHAYYNELVHGGKTPFELLKLCQLVRKQRRQKNLKRAMYNEEDPE